MGYLNNRGLGITFSTFSKALQETAAKVFDQSTILDKPVLPPPPPTAEETATVTTYPTRYASARRTAGSTYTTFRRITPEFTQVQPPKLPTRTTVAQDLERVASMPVRISTRRQVSVPVLDVRTQPTTVPAPMPPVGVTPTGPFVGTTPVPDVTPSGIQKAGFGAVGWIVLGLAAFVLLPGLLGAKRGRRRA